MCGEIEEAVAHVLAARKMPAQKHYTNKGMTKQPW